MENKKFSDMNISNSIKKTLEDRGYEEATAIQTAAIEPIMEGRDVLGLAQTGTGKTIAFAIPIIENIDRDDNVVQTLILCPTRELVLQICEEITTLLKYTESVRVAPIYGGQQIEKQIFLLKKHPQIIVGTPGRIMDHLRRKTIRLNNIKSIVLDEADEMLNMGFKEDIDIILTGANENRQTILFSATMSKAIKEIANTFQKNPLTIEIEHETLTVPKIKQYYIEVNESKKTDLLDRIISSTDVKLGLIFCNTKKKVDELTSALQMRGYSVESLHGDMRQSARDNVLSKFRNNKLQLLIATDVAARGIDVNNIEAVFNYDVPIDDEYYVHRIGRTGRAGKEGMALTLITSREHSKIKYIEKYTKADIEKYVLPTIDSVIESKVSKLLSKVEPSINSVYTKFVDTYLDSNPDLTISDVAISLVEQMLGPIMTEHVDDLDNQVRMFINLGRMDDLSKSQLVRFIANKAGISTNEINDLEVYDKYSFFNTSDQASSKIISGLNGTDHNGRQVAVELSSEKPKEGNRKKRSFNQGKSRGRRDDSYQGKLKRFMPRDNKNSMPRDNKNFKKRKYNGK